MYCRVCGMPIPPGRLEAVPNTTTCVQHSSTKPYVGFMDYPHKTGAQMVLVNPDDKEQLRLARRAFKRSR